MGTFTLSPLCVLSLFSAAIFPANLGGQRAESLREATRGRFMIGAAVTAAQLDRPETADLILKQFNHLTAEYEFMPLFMETGPGRFDFKRSDRIVDFAHLHHLPLTGHMLCWHQITPQWMFEDAEHHPLPRERALANLKLYINTVVTHFRGKLDSWNVVNEAVSDKPLEYLRDNPALRSIGIDYVQKAFEFAHAADPNVPLYYNDYNVEDQAKLPKVQRLIRSLKKEGVRLDAVGIQGHWYLDYPDSDLIDACIVTLGKEGLKVLVTELDIDVVGYEGADRYKSGIPADVLNQEAKRYASLFEIFLKHQDIIPVVTFWGLEDGQSWLNYTPRIRTNYPLLFDRRLNPKPAYHAVIDTLSRK